VFTLRVCMCTVQRRVACRLCFHLYSNCRIAQILLFTNLFERQLNDFQSFQHKDVADAYYNIARLHVHNKRYAEGAEYFVKTYRFYLHNFGMLHPEVCAFFYSLRYAERQNLKDIEEKHVDDGMERKEEEEEREGRARFSDRDVGGSVDQGLHISVTHSHIRLFAFAFVL